MLDDAPADEPLEVPTASKVPVSPAVPVAAPGADEPPETQCAIGPMVFIAGRLGRSGPGSVLTST